MHPNTRFSTPTGLQHSTTAWRNPVGVDLRFSQPRTQGSPPSAANHGLEDVAPLGHSRVVPPFLNRHYSTTLCCGCSRGAVWMATRLMAFKNALPLASTLSVETPRPR